MSRHNKQKGVYYDTGRGLWGARVFYQGRKLNLGRFDTEDKAAEIVMRAEGYIAAGIPRNMWWSSRAAALMNEEIEKGLALVNSITDDEWRELAEMNRLMGRSNIHELRSAKSTTSR